jgi:hypothetical protein
MIDDRAAAGFTRKMSFKQYKRMKRQMLRDFQVTLTSEEEARWSTLTTEIQVDQFCLMIINNRWQ